ncbi:thermonuclease family protein [Croceicoccus bisphenolivorans]|uniref:thermonuclease family protein n=1 Tax=Croceicoccus bisphenolivorans TaxID=1783232 RepID=UPI0009EE18F4|nr:thermonuclease family protein [Croceicoccus bisphenolivorans]
MNLFRNARRNGGWASIAIIAASVALVIAGLYLRLADTDESAIPQAAATLPEPGPQDTLQADFALCSSAARRDCVVDGDTFWLGGEKYRVLDINTPETSTPRCDRELALGKAATQRLLQLLNGGAFSLESGPEQTDRYGRKLRRVMRGGQSLGDILVAEGLAEKWKGFRRNWC